MFNNDNISKIKRLKFENILWILFAVLCIMNIMGDVNEIDFIDTNNKNFKNKANLFFETTLKITLLIYTYFFIRNYNAYIRASKEEKRLYSIKLLGSSLLIAGILCLIYFQTSQDSFTGSPSL